MDRANYGELGCDFSGHDACSDACDFLWAEVLAWSCGGRVLPWSHLLFEFVVSRGPARTRDRSVHGSGPDKRTHRRPAFRSAAGPEWSRWTRRVAMAVFSR